MFNKQSSRLLSAVGIVAVLSLLLSSIGVSFGAPATSALAAPQMQAGVQEVPGGTANMAAPVRFTPAYSSTVPVASAAQLAKSQAEDARIQAAREKHALAQPHDSTIVGSPNFAGQTSAANIGVIQPNYASAPFTIFQNTKLFPTTGSSSINEPAHATQGKDVFYTGNWYAAHSIDGGLTWGYVNPYADFPNFCCDQDVAQDPARNMIMWWRQGILPAAGLVNKDKLSISVDGGASFWTYDFLPTNVNSAWTNQWFDYPHLAVSNQYLYITTNMFSSTFPYPFLRMLVMRMPLGALSNAAGFTYNYWTSTTGWSWTPVQGATDVMYLGDTYDQSTSTFRLYSQNEADSTLSYVDRAIAPWTFTNRNGNCPVPNGKDPCDRADQRVTDGWVAKGVVGFFWNVKEGGSFPYPYVESATFVQNGGAYLGRPYIWNGSFAFQYGSAAPNENGDLGIGVFGVGGGSYPTFYVGIDDGFNGAPPGWEIATGATSSSWTSNAMGDYIRVRTFEPLGTFWTASAYNYQLGAYNPKYVVFGRARDTAAWLRWHLK